MFDLDKNLNLYAKGMVPDEFSKPATFKEWAAVVIPRFIELGAYYEKTLAGDGKMVGIEKKEIIEQLSIIFNAILALRLQVNEKKDMEFSLKKEKRGIINFVFSSSTFWELKGTLPGNYKVRVDKFSQWFNKNFSGKFKELISTYGKALEDGVITPEEKESIYEVIDPTLFEIIIIVLYLERTLVNQ